MGTLHKVLLGLGTNQQKKRNMSEASTRLSQYFPGIRFSETAETFPIACPSDETFLNRVAVAYTGKSVDEIKILCKKIETDLGRTESSRQKGEIAIDIDLLKWNDTILKASDLERDYIKKLLAALGE